MRRPAVLFGLAALLAGAHQLANLAGLARHASAIAGMPLSAASDVIGPAFVALHLAAAVVAPILMIAATADALLRLAPRGTPSAPRSGSAQPSSSEARASDVSSVAPRSVT